MKLLMMFLISFLWSSHSLSESSWRDQAVLVRPNSPMQKLIDDLVIEIFESPLQKALCTSYMNSSSVAYSLGVSLEAAHLAFKGCAEQPMRPSKTLKKQYYIALESQSDLDSWTDFGNRTYLFLDQDITREKLKAILIHELGISLDAKANMLYTTYLRYLLSQQQVSQGMVVVDVTHLSEDEKKLQGAFNQSTWRPVSLAFATMRAFRLELISQGLPQPSDHSTCVANFLRTFEVVKNLPTPPRSAEVDSISEILAETASLRSAPRSIEEENKMLEDLLSENLKIKDLQGQKRTFCQFMAQPLLTGRTLYNIFGTGPRPRLTGGSGGQGGQSLSLSSESGAIGKSENAFEVSKPTIEDLKLRRHLREMKRMNELVKKEDGYQTLTPGARERLNLLQQQFDNEISY